MTDSTEVPRFTLDTNCIIAIDEQRPEASAIRKLCDACASGLIDLAVVGISASEKQKGGGTLDNFQLFLDRLSRLGLQSCTILKPMLYFDICFFDWSYWSSPEMEVLEESIHQTLFPNIELHWSDYCAARNLDPNAIDHCWRNAKCDTQALWAHIWHKRDVFVTSDGDFHSASKITALSALGAGKIERPEAAVLFIPV
jgi:hypothetical protein